MKRLIDVSLSAVGLLIALPLFAIIAIAIKLTSPGPIFFRQERVGMAGRRFTLLKFRTMRTGTTGAGVTSSNDRRITSPGRLLRRYKLDELPQVLNVLAGQMSIVGPRPELPKFVESFQADYEHLLTVRPGLTDFATLEYRNEEILLARAEDVESAYLSTVLPAKIALSRRYVAEMSLKTDMKLILRTALALIR